MEVLFPKLLWMTLYNLTNMKEIVDGPLEAGSFVKLKELDVFMCNQLRNIFQLPTEIDTVHLEKLKIENCESMEEVIKWEGREEDATSKLQFPKLKELEIQESCVICFCKGAKEIEFHQLDRLELSELPGVEFLISGSNENRFKSMFPRKILFPRLEQMNLRFMRNVKEIWCDQPQAGSFCNLAKLYIEGCDSLEYVFSPCMVRYLVHLHTLSINQCRSLKEVVAAEKDKDVEEHSRSILPKLQSVTLIGLPALGTFCHIAKDLEFPVMEKIWVVDCPGFKTFAPGYVFFPRLEEMNLKFMPNVKEIWCDQPQAESFCNLAKLYIEGCDSLEYVFNPCMARYLVHLHTLSINQCRILKEVVAAENDKDVEEHSLSILPELQFVTLIDLPALGTFCHIAKDLVFPVMEKIWVIDCPGFKTFAPGYVHTPKLNRVIINQGNKTLWNGNLSNTIQRLYKERSTTTTTRTTTRR